MKTAGLAAVLDLIRKDRFLEADALLHQRSGRQSAETQRQGLADELWDRMMAQAASLVVREDYPSAERVLSRLRRRRPRDYAMRILWARMRRRQNRLAQAEAGFRRARELRPERLTACLHLAETMAVRRKTAEASGLLRSALGRCAVPGTGDVDGLQERFLAALYGFEFSQAAATGERILDETRRMRDLRRLGWACLVYDFRSNDQPRELVGRLLKKLDAFLLRRPRDPWLLFWRLYFERIDGEKGRPEILRATLSRLGARYDWMRYEIGKCLFESGDFRGAESEFKAAVRSSRPLNWRAQCFYAEALWCQGKWPSALEAFSRAETMVPDDDREGMLTWKGEVLLWAGDYAQGLSLIRASIADVPCDAHCWEGAALSLLGRPREALRSLDKAVALNPRRVEARLWRAETLLGLSRRKQALAEAEEAIRCLPGKGSDSRNFYCHVVRGLARAAMKDDAGAERDYFAVPAAVRDFAVRKLGLVPAGSAKDRSAVLRKILELSRGVRRDHYVPSWLRGRDLQSSSKTATRFSSKAKRSGF